MSVFDKARSHLGVFMNWASLALSEIGPKVFTFETVSDDSSPFTSSFGF